MGGQEREGRGGEGRSGEFTAEGFFHAEASFPRVWGEFLGESCGQEALGRLGT